MVFSYENLGKDIFKIKMETKNSNRKPIYLYTDNVEKAKEHYHEIYGIDDYTFEVCKGKIDLINDEEFVYFAKLYVAKQINNIISFNTIVLAAYTQIARVIDSEYPSYKFIGYEYEIILTLFD